MLIYDLAYFDIRICVGLWSVCCRFVIGLSSRLSVCCRLRFQHCANGRFSFGVMSVIYLSQIGRFHTESYPKWPRHEADWFYSVFRNIVGGRQLDDSLKNLRFFVGFVSVWPVWLRYQPLRVRYGIYFADSNYDLNFASVTAVMYAI